MRPVRIANFSGFFGDRASALAEMVKAAEADVLTGDYLAEVTMSILAKLRDRDPNAGYAASFVAHLRPVLAEFSAGESRIVVNAGGLNPQGLAQQVRDMAREAGHPLTVATVSGDDVIGQLDDLELLDEGDEFVPITANAYLGGWGIAQALADGARVVICGRVADASLVIGAAAWWHQWERDAWDPLAGALIAGHLIECGTQMTGGNFSGFLSADLSQTAFPIAEIDEGGTVVVSKLEPSGGLVSVDTVKAQLVYEIQGRWYANPDVLADLASMQIHETDDNVVTISGTVGAPPPSTTKVAMTGAGPWQNSMMIGLTGTDFTAKCAVLEKGLRDGLRDVKGISMLQVEQLGHQAEAPTTQNEATGFIRVVARGTDESAVGRKFSNAMVELALASFPGIYLTAPPGRATRLGAYRSVYIEQDIPVHLVVDDNGQETVIEPPTTTTPYIELFDPQDDMQAVDCVDGDPLEEARLGELVHARSGDKGGNANLGVWVEDDARWPWLRDWLTVSRLRTLMPETDGLQIDRIALPNLRAVNFVIRDLLGEGAIASLRLDSQAKGLSEFLRACRAEVPTKLLTESPR